MQIVKVYDKNLALLVTFTNKDFVNLTYKRTQGEIGDCSFTLAISEKTTSANIQHYNRVRIYDDGDLVFTGLITQKHIALNTIDIRCREQSYILKKRVTPANYVMNGTITDVITTLLNSINATEDTGITIGILAGVESVNLTFNRADVWTVIKRICDSTGNQFEITPTGALNIRNQLGLDLSSIVYLRYDINQIANANIFRFDIDDNGDDIATKAYGESNGLNSLYADMAGIASYGLLETYKDFRVVNTQPVLDEFTTLEVADRVYSPKITLKPEVDDNFSIFDFIRIKLKNNFVNIDSSYQVIQKIVKFLGDQKVIELRINNLPSSLSQILGDRDKRLTLLEKQL